MIVGVAQASPRLSQQIRILDPRVNSRQVLSYERQGVPSSEGSSSVRMFLLRQGVPPSSGCSSFFRGFLLRQSVPPPSGCFSSTRVFLLPQGVPSSSRCSLGFVLLQGVPPPSRCSFSVRVFLLRQEIEATYSLVILSLVPLIMSRIMLIFKLFTFQYQDSYMDCSS